MTALKWDQTERHYEFGVDRGLIDLDGFPIRPWNGLISVNESEVNTTDVKAQFDGISYVNQHFGGIYQATVIAYGFVDGFEAILGQAKVVDGFLLTSQVRSGCNFSYRTRLGENDYKIHFVYNAFFTATSRDSTTVNSAGHTDTRTWKVDALPVTTEDYYRSSHFVVDTSKVSESYLESLEKFLYGAPGFEPGFPTKEQLLTFS